MTTGYPGSLFTNGGKRRSGNLMIAAVVMMLLGLIILLGAWISSMLLTPPRDRVRTETVAESILEAQFVPTIQPEVSAAPQETQATKAMQAAQETPLAAPLLVNAEYPIVQTPDTLVALSDVIEPSLASVKEAGSMADREAALALRELLEAASVDGIGSWQITDAYRSVETQQEIWDKTIVKYREQNGLSESKALLATQRRVATPGTSEHHTGLAFDMGVAGQSFRKTQQCVWLAENCADFGFIIRYTEDKEALTGITAEPWHIRYVGVTHAKAMEARRLCLEEYVALLGSSEA